MLDNGVYNAAEQAVYNEGDGKTQAAGEHHPQLEYGPTPGAQRDGRPAEYRWRPLLNTVDQFAKISLWCNLGTKKRRAVLSNYKLDIHEI